ncbi:sugar transferase [Verrucomicrobiales bacterium]|nr:sugar transferase [Verrucomicrobiales bacterium]
MNASTSVNNRAKRRPEVIENTTIFVILADSLVVLGSLVLSFFIRFHYLGQIGVSEPGMTLGQYAVFMGMGIVGALLIFGHSHLYENQYLLSPRKSFPRISRSCLLWFVCYLAALRLLEPGLAQADQTSPASRLYLLMAPGVLLVEMTLWRYLLCKLIWRCARQSRLIENVLFLGWNQDCADAGEIMTADRGSPMVIAGAIRPPGQDFAQPLPEGMKDFGEFCQLSDVLGGGQIDMLITTDTELDRNDLGHAITLCEKEMVGFQLVPTCFRVLLSGLSLDRIFGMPLLGISKLPLHSRVNLFLKRVIDAVGGFVGLVLSAPLIAVFGAIIYLQSPGPIFYRQRRVGQRGREFDIIKLRSMKLDSEAGTGAVWTVENDPRRLKIGRFLRASNIDEVPQFWNVLIGEMSLVGPRPERPELIRKFRDEIPHYNARHAIKPGITGWAQVNGFRGNTDLTERVKYDLHYIERWNLLFDFQIMFLTFLKRDNAY